MLKKLANYGVTSILVEGGPSILRSFFNEGLIDELYEYTAPGILNGNDMKNPINLDSSWNCVNQKSLGNDKLVIYQKKEIECLVE